jgi:type II secretory pathway pseudopilin PulG
MKKHAFTVTDMLAVITVLVLLLGILLPALKGPRHTAARMVCQTNLKGIGRAMAVYAADNGGSYPRAGGAGSTWATTGYLPRWFKPDWTKAFGASRGAGQATVTSSFYLLVKYYGIKTEQFVCKGDGARVFKIAETHAPSMGYQLEDVWDFCGKDRVAPYRPGEYVSYAYHMPYEAPNPHREPGQPPTTSFVVLDQFNPGTAVAADRNPHLDVKGDSMAPLDVEQNSFAHQEKGQNVMFKDSSVRFYKNTVKVGIGGDNIYTWGTLNPEGGDEAGTAPTGNGDNSGPGGQEDAYLVSERNEH